MALKAVLHSTFIILLRPHCRADPSLFLTTNQSIQNIVITYNSEDKRMD
uniref:Uncharacterized protein n=1 Tax=Rhodnius prolixus TaxID=13249 RepID=T1HRI7_RHOPR